MAADPIDFWFTMGSTYSYLSVMRLGDLERSSGIRFRWRPFHLLVMKPFSCGSVHNALNRESISI
jgi:2-hydroxychromene-2-carboxylate isomerase